MPQYFQPPLAGTNDHSLSTPRHRGALQCSPEQLAEPEQMACFPSRQNFLQVTK